MAKDAPVVIGDRQYVLRYTLESRQEIEEKLGKGLFEAMFSGELKAHATIVAVGLKHAIKDVSPAKVIRMFEAHLAAEPDNSYEAILQTAYRAIFEGKLLGRVKDEAALKKLLDIEDEEGKGQTATS